MSFTMGRSYGTSKNNRVPSSNANSQSLKTPDTSGKSSSSKSSNSSARAFNLSQDRTNNTTMPNTPTGSPINTTTGTIPSMPGQGLPTNPRPSNVPAPSQTVYPSIPNISTPSSSPTGTGTPPTMPPSSVTPGMPPNTITPGSMAPGTKTPGTTAPGTAAPNQSGNPTPTTPITSPIINQDNSNISPGGFPPYFHRAYPQDAPQNNSNMFNIPYYMNPTGQTQPQNSQPPQIPTPISGTRPMPMPTPTPTGGTRPMPMPTPTPAGGTRPMPMPTPTPTGGTRPMPMPTPTPTGGTRPMPMPTPTPAGGTRPMPMPTPTPAGGTRPMPMPTPTLTPTTPPSGSQSVNPGITGAQDINFTNTNPYVAPMGVPLFPLYGYDNTADYEKDVLYIRQLYPKAARMIQREIDNEADHMEYDGSLMFDEHPDKVSLEMIADRIYAKLKEAIDQTQVEAESIYLFPQDYQRDYYHDLVYVMFLNEVFNRRRRYRGRKRWF